MVYGWLCFFLGGGGGGGGGLTALGDSISVYNGPSPREREKEERNDRR